MQVCLLCEKFPVVLEKFPVIINEIYSEYLVNAVFLADFLLLHSNCTKIYHSN